jgi:hypothetical protein
MPLYVQRDHHQKIIAVFQQPTLEAQEIIVSYDPELLAFLQENDESSREDTLASLENSDPDMIRVIEDLIDILIKKNIIRFTDFPDIVQAKILARQKIRDHLRGLI